MRLGGGPWPAAPYDPGLDLSVEGLDGAVVGDALFWFDGSTGVRMFEPMRVEEPYRRRGLARALLTNGLDRLAALGARRLKVGFDGDARQSLGVGVGFAETATLRSFRRASTTER